MRDQELEEISLGLKSYKSQVERIRQVHELSESASFSPKYSRGRLVGFRVSSIIGSNANNVMTEGYQYFSLSGEPLSPVIHNTASLPGELLIDIAAGGITASFRTGGLSAFRAGASTSMRSTAVSETPGISVGAMRAPGGGTTNILKRLGASDNQVEAALKGHWISVENAVEGAESTWIAIKLENDTVRIGIIFC